MIFNFSQNRKLIRKKKNKIMSVRKFKFAAVQMAVGASKPANLATAAALVRKAASAGARVVALPECFCCPYGNEYFGAYADVVPGGGTTRQLQEMARENRVLLIGGSQVLLILFFFFALLLSSSVFYCLLMYSFLLLSLFFFIIQFSSCSLSFLLACWCYFVLIKFENNHKLSSQNVQKMAQDDCTTLVW